MFTDDVYNFVPPQLLILKDGRFELAEDFTVRYGDEKIVTVPKGFITDGASIPRMLWRLCGHPLEVPRIYAAIVHDYYYTTGEVSRAEADEIYYDLLRQFGVNWFKAKIEYYALRMFGGSHYVANLIIIALLITACGCASDRARNIELSGMYASQSGTLAIGQVDIMASTTAGESATIKYSEDTAWLSPSTKTHEIKIQLTGTNAVSSASNIVNSICNAFTQVAENQKEPNADATAN